METIITQENLQFYFDLIKRSTSNGKMFSVIFTKKDGSEHKMTARRGVSKYLKGGKLGYNPDDYSNIIVADANIMRENAKLVANGMKEKNPYRTIKVSSLKQIKIGGNIFKFI